MIRKLSGWKPEPAHVVGTHPSYGLIRDRMRDATRDLRVEEQALFGMSSDLRPFSSPRHDQGNTNSCFPAGTMVLMADGRERPIEDVAERNEVLTHDGHRRAVTACMRRPYSGKLYTVHLHGNCYPLTMTSEHPVLAAPNVSLAARRHDPGELSWTQAELLQPGWFVLMPTGIAPTNISRVDVIDYLGCDLVLDGDLVRVPSARRYNSIPRFFQLSERFARLIGLFLAEGSYLKPDGRYTGIAFTFGRNETEYHKFVSDAVFEIFRVSARTEESHARSSSTTIVCQSRTLGLFLCAFCGEGALGKFVPSCFFGADEHVRMALVRGWLEGDGTQRRVYEYENGRPNQALCTGVTSSEQLHRGMFRLSMANGLVPSASLRSQAAHQNAPGRNLSFYSHDITRLFPEEAQRVADAGIVFSTKHRRHRKHELGVLCRVKSVEVSQPEDPVEVYNLEVETEHTYIANGVAVHNCVANALVKALEIKRIQKYGRDAHVDLSVLEVYYRARELEGPEATRNDNGSMIYLAAQVLLSSGVCTDDAWPFDESKVNLSPSWWAMGKAYTHKIASWNRIDSIEDDRVADCIVSLAAGFPVVFGTTVGNNWLDYQKGEVLWRTDDVLGRHATVLVGWQPDLHGGVFIGENSWGSEWGDDGFYLLDPAVIASRDTAEATVITGGWEEWASP